MHSSNSSPKSEFIKRLLPPSCRSVITFLTKTPEEFTYHTSSLYLDIAQDGRILYDPSGYAAEWLRTLLRRIEKAGLHREQTSAGFIWEWDRLPLSNWSLEWDM
jgi:hypothetical protein